LFKPVDDRFLLLDVFADFSELPVYFVEIAR